MPLDIGLSRRLTSLASAAYSSIILWYAKGKQRPVFFNIEETKPHLRDVTRHWEAIWNEVRQQIGDHRLLPRYHDLDPLQEMISAEDNGANWRVLMLSAYGEKFQQNRAKLPATSAYVDAIPDVCQAFVSILEPGKSVPAHNGPLAGILRYHLCLKTAQLDRPKIRVRDQWHEWSEGKAILFDDTWEHEVVNNAKEIRVVLIVDILRPLPPILHHINKLYLMVGARFFYARGVLNAHKSKNEER